MKSASFVSNFAASLLVNFLFALKYAAAQQTGSDLFEDNAPMNKAADPVAQQIASIYGADAQTVEAYVQAAVAYQDQIGVPATVVVAIAVYESSFNSYLFLNSGNPFGIKAGADWKGPTFSKWDDGAETPFRVYNSPAEAVLDFGAFIRSRGWYADALACSRYDYVCVVEGLKKTDAQPGYSSNPEWDEKVLELIERLGLEVLSEQ